MCEQRAPVVYVVFVTRSDTKVMRRHEERTVMSLAVYFYEKERERARERERKRERETSVSLHRAAHILLLHVEKWYIPVYIEEYISQVFTRTTPPRRLQSEYRVRYTSLRAMNLDLSV